MTSPAERRVTIMIFGRDGIFSINLGAMGDTGFGDGEWRNIKCNIVQNAEPSVADPSGLIPGWTSYRVHFTTSLGPNFGIGAVINYLLN
jgi:hypothetical protein